MRDRRSAWQPDEDGLYDPTEDGLDEEVYYPMVRQFSALAEVRKHPGIAAGVVAILAGVGLATLLLNQRTGPTRLETLRGRFNPRGWIDTAGLRTHIDDLAETVRRGVGEVGDRASEFGDEAAHRSRRFLEDTRRGSRKALKKHGRRARRYAAEAGEYARDHAKEGGTILALATIAAAIGAAALDARRPDSRLRSLGRF